MIFFAILCLFRMDSKDFAGETPALPGLFTGLSDRAYGYFFAVTAMEY